MAALMQRMSSIIPRSMSFRKSSNAASEGDDDAESMETLANRMGLISPDGKKKVKWDWFILGLVFYTGFVTPFCLSFKDITDYDVSPPFMVFDTMVNVCYIFDIFVSWRTTYYDREGMLVLDKKAARRNYVRTWLPIDVIASFPFDYFLELCTVGSDVNIPKGVRLPSVLKLLRIGRLGKKIDRLSSSKMFRIFQFTFMLIFAAHWYACLWFWQGNQAEPKNGTLVTLPGADGTSWVFLKDIDNEDVSFQYVASLYWAVTTLMKSPWFHPTSPGEFASALVMIIFGCVLFAYFIGNVTAVITAANASGGRYRAQVGELKGFCSAHGINAKLTAKLLVYQEALWNETSGGMNRADMVNKYVPTHLLPHVHIEMFKQLLPAAPFLFDLSGSCCIGFLRALKTCIVDRGDVLMKAGSLRRTMYVLMKGEIKIAYEKDAPKETVEFYAPGARVGSKQVKDLSKRKSHMDSVRGRTDKMGTLIGFQDVFKKMEPLPFSATATVRTSLLSISRGQLKELLTTYPDDREGFEKAIEFANTSMENSAGGRRSASDGMKRATTKLNALNALNSDPVNNGEGNDSPATARSGKVGFDESKPGTPSAASALERIKTESKLIEEKEKKASAELAEQTKDKPGTPGAPAAAGGTISGVSSEEVADLRRKIDTLTKIVSEQFTMIEHQSEVLSKLTSGEGDHVVPFSGTTPRQTSTSDAGAADADGTDTSPHQKRRSSDIKEENVQNVAVLLG